MYLLAYLTLIGYPTLHVPLGSIGHKRRKEPFKHAGFISGHLLTSTNNPTAALLSHVTTRLSSAPALRPAVTNSTNNTLYARSAGAAYDEWVNVTTAAGQLNTSTSQSHGV